MSTSEPAVDPLALDLPTLAVLAADAVSADAVRALRDAGYDGVRVAHGYLVQRLLVGEPTIGEFAEALGVTQQAASKWTVELLDLGLVERVDDAADRRVRRIRLSPRGRAMVDAHRARRAELEAGVAASGVDVDAARAALVALLEATGGLEAVRRRGARPPAP